jgi:DNA-binding transcriptional regulator YiaG
MIMAEKELTIAERCQLLRERLRLSQQEMANHLGVSLQGWQNWEAGKRQPRGPALKLIEQMEDWQPVDYAERCHNLRLKLGLNKGEMAERIGCTPYTWGQWESGDRRPQPDARKKIDELLAGGEQ